MGTYIEWNDVVSRYNKASDMGDSDELQDNYIQYAEAELEGRLHGYFTIPFSSNNLTAKDLAIDLTYAKINLTRDIKKHDSIIKFVDKTIDKLKSANMAMAVSSGTPLISAGNSAAWSSTENYNPAFDMNDQEDQWIDDDQQEDEYTQRT